MVGALPAPGSGQDSSWFGSCGGQVATCIVHSLLAFTHGNESLPFSGGPSLSLGRRGQRSHATPVRRRVHSRSSGLSGLGGARSRYLGSVHGYHHEQNSVPKASDLLGCMAERGTIRHRPAVVRSVSWTEERVGNAVAPLPLARHSGGTPGLGSGAVLRFRWGGCCVRH